MESSAWTNELLDDLAESMRTGFAQVDQDVRDLRTEMRDEFTHARTEMREGFTELRGEMREGFTEVREEINDLRLVMLSVGGAMIVALVGVIAAILARGV
jgi:hypothetical protein